MALPIPVGLFSFIYSEGGLLADLWSQACMGTLSEA